MKKLLIIFITMCSAFALRAQNDGYSLEAIGHASPIIRDQVQKLPETAKTKDTTLPAPSFTYNLQPKKYTTTVQLDTIRPAKIGSEPVQKLYRTYARLGLGNYAAFYGEFYAGSLRSKTGAYDMHLRHFSCGQGPKDVQGKFDGFSQEDFNLSGKRFLKHHTLSGGLDYDRDVVYYYGSADTADAFTKAGSRQHFDYFAISGGLQSHLTDSSSINHAINARYYHMGDRFKVKEDNFMLDVNAGRFIHAMKIDALVGVDYNRNSGESDTVSSTIVKFQPMFGSHDAKFDAAIGMNVSIDAGPDTRTYFFPQARFSYDFVNHIIIPYITVAGYLERNSYRSLTLVNPFMLPASSFSLRNTQHKYEVSAGLRGSISSEIVYDVHATRVELVNAPFFVNTTSAQDPFRNKFAVVYDTVTVAQVHGQLGWQKFEKIRVVATGDWYHYTMSSEAKPWHTPTLRLSLLGEYNLQDKIIGRLDIYYLNGQYAKIQQGNSFETVTLKGLVDVNVGLEYRYTKFLSAFINFNNVAAQRYQRWYAYPTQKFNFLAGLTYTF